MIKEVCVFVIMSELINEEVKDEEEEVDEESIAHVSPLEVCIIDEGDVEGEYVS